MSDPTGPSINCAAAAEPEEEDHSSVSDNDNQDRDLLDDDFLQDNRDRDGIAQPREEGSGEESSVSSNDEPSDTDDDERFFSDDEDQAAFGHWDENYRAFIRALGNDSSIVRCFGRMARNNIQGVPHLNVDACKQLGKYLRRAPYLTKLSFQSMGLTGDCVRALFLPWMEENANSNNNSRSKIEVLNLDDNGDIGSDHMLAVSSFLQNNVKLMELILPSVGLAMGGAQNLAHALSNQQHLVLLNLAFNALGDDDVTVLTRALRNVATLKELDLGSNGIHRYSCIAPLFENGTLCTSLTRLTLRSNKIDDDFLQQFGIALLGNHHLEVIELEGNDFGRDGLESLLRLLISRNIGGVVDANHCISSFGVIGYCSGLMKYDTTKQIGKMLAINRLVLSQADKARQKLNEYYFAAIPLDQNVLDIDIKLMPRIFCSIGMGLPTQRTSTATEYRRFKILYNVVRNWNMPSLFDFPSLDEM